MSAYKNYHSSFDSVDLYFHADRFYPIPFSLTGSDILGENFTSVDIIKKLGVNAPEHSFSPKMFPSFDDLLRDLPKDGAIIQNSIFFKVSIDKESISYDVDFTKFPTTDN